MNKYQSPFEKMELIGYQGPVVSVSIEAFGFAPSSHQAFGGIVQVAVDEDGGPVCACNLYVSAEYYVNDMEEADSYVQNDPRCMPSLRRDAASEPGLLLRDGPWGW